MSRTGIVGSAVFAVLFFLIAPVQAQPGPRVNVDSSRETSEAMGRGLEAFAVDGLNIPLKPVVPVFSVALLTLALAASAAWVVGATCVPRQLDLRRLRLALRCRTPNRAPPPG